MGRAEDVLKELILSKYKSIREFTSAADMPYSTFDTILKRGVRSASVDNLIRVCDTLGISADALVNGAIEYKIPTTIAAHLDTDELTEEELEDIADYIVFIKNKRKK